ncbi:hypothetical protein BDW22DRAFT_1295705, partial [Trametopsis cervina]
SKANFTETVPLPTGGSWKKSPVTMTYIVGSTFLLNILPMRASLSKRSPSTIDT